MTFTNPLGFGVGGETRIEARYGPGANLGVSTNADADGEYDNYIQEYPQIDGPVLHPLAATVAPRYDSESNRNAPLKISLPRSTEVT